jgi:hypothetical protein
MIEGNIVIKFNSKSNKTSHTKFIADVHYDPSNESIGIDSKYFNMLVRMNTEDKNIVQAVIDALAGNTDNEDIVFLIKSGVGVLKDTRQ